MTLLGDIAALWALTSGLSLGYILRLLSREKRMADQKWTGTPVVEWQTDEHGCEFLKLPGEPLVVYKCQHTDCIAKATGMLHIGLHLVVIDSVTLVQRPAMMQVGLTAPDTAFDFLVANAEYRKKGLL